MWKTLREFVFGVDAITPYQKLLNHATEKYPTAFQKNQIDVIRLVKYFCKQDNGTQKFDNAMENFWFSQI